MVLVLFFILFLVLPLLLFLLGKIRIQVKKLFLDSTCIKNTQWEIAIELYIAEKIKIFSTNINASKMQNARIQKVIKKLKSSKFIQKLREMNLKEFENNMLSAKELKQYGKMLKLEIEKFIFKIEIDTKDIIATTMLVPILATILAFLLRNFITNYEEMKYQYSIVPLYKNRNTVKIEGTGIISLKLVHIISILYTLVKKGRRKKNGSTSNRRANAHCYE